MGGDAPQILFDTLKVSPTKIGAGSFAYVYKAQHPALGIVALKCLLPQHAVGLQLELFQHEAALLSKFSHSNIIKCHGVCTIPREVAARRLGGLKWSGGAEMTRGMVLEFCEGGPLSQRLAEQMIYRQNEVYSTEDALDWSIDIARALLYLQQQSPIIIHRDLKQENVLLTRDAASGRMMAKLSDFGLAKEVDRTRAKMLRSRNGPYNPTTPGQMDRLFSPIPPELLPSLMEVAESQSRMSICDERTITPGGSLHRGTPTGRSSAATPGGRSSEPSMRKRGSEPSLRGGRFGGGGNSGTLLSAALDRSFRAGQRASQADTSTHGRSSPTMSIQLLAATTDASYRPASAASGRTGGGTGKRGSADTSTHGRSSPSSLGEVLAPSPPLMTSAPSHRRIGGATASTEPAAARVIDILRQSTLGSSALSVRPSLGCVSHAPLVSTTTSATAIHGNHEARERDSHDLAMRFSSSTCTVVPVVPNGTVPHVPPSVPPAMPPTAPPVQLSVGPLVSIKSTSFEVAHDSLVTASLADVLLETIGEHYHNHLPRQSAGRSAVPLVASHHHEAAGGTNGTRRTAVPPHHSEPRALSVLPVGTAGEHHHDGNALLLLSSQSATHASVTAVRPSCSGEGRRDSGTAEQRECGAPAADISEGTVRRSGFGGTGGQASTWGGSAPMLSSPFQAASVYDVLNAAGKALEGRQLLEGQKSEGQRLEGRQLEGRQSEGRDSSGPHPKGWPVEPPATAAAQNGGGIDTLSPLLDVLEMEELHFERDWQHVFTLTGVTGSALYMAPEVFLNLPYNEKVDTFSLGVVMYELFSHSLLIFTHTGIHGRTLLNVKTATEFASAVARGYRPNRPEQMHTAVWEIIQECWNDDPCVRPNLQNLVLDLEAILGSVRHELTTAHGGQAPICRCVIA